MKFYFYVGFTLVLVLMIVPAGWALTEMELREAILEKIPATQDMDINGDGKLDVADLVRIIDGSGSMCTSLVGEHIGTFYRNGGELIEGREGLGGQVSFALKITNDTPFNGEIDNQSGSELGYYSLYFPAGKISVTILQPDETRLEFEFNFTTISSDLSPDVPLYRHMKFSGQFSDSTRRVLTGTYTEDISGFKDNQNNEIPIHLTGSFIMVMECGK